MSKNTKSTKGNSKSVNSSLKPRKARVQNNKSRSNASKAVLKVRQQSAPVAFATGQLGKAPIIRASRDSCRVVHRELITSVTGSSDFTVQESFPLNPGMAITFPWLSNQAKSWEMYKFHSLRFKYFTRTGTSTAGSLIMSPDYDAADQAPVSETIASSYEDTVEDAPWKDITCICRGERLKGLSATKFIRSSALANNLDIKTYDSGNLHLCTTDGAAVNWGKLWVEYDVEFSVPQIFPVGFPEIAGGRILGGGTGSDVNPFGDGAVMDPQSVGFSIDDASLMTVAKPGSYLVVFQTQFATTLTGMSLTAVSASGSQVNSVINATINAAATSGIRAYEVVTVVENATFQFSFTAAAVNAGGTLAWLAIAPTLSLQLDELKNKKVKSLAKC